MPTNTFPVNKTELLEKAINSQNIEELLNSFKPDNFMYVHLKNGLANYREIAENGGWQKVITDKVLKPEMEDESVISLRQYLKITGDLPQNIKGENESLFDEDVENAVKKFQFRHNLTQDGVVGKGTLAAINVPVEQRIDEIRANLERARWVMHHLEDDFMVVNIAGYNLRRITNDSVMFYSKIIVGKHYHETPIFRNKIKYIILNPTWTLTHSIAVKETLPKLKKDPKYLAKHNMIIMDHSGKVIDPSTLDFKKMSSRDFHYVVRQNAGPNNSLGQVKFIFPNSYSVYIHDTPARSLFNREKRAFSHGCLRLDKKWDLFFSLVDDPEWTQERLDEVLESGKTTRVNLKNPIDVVILYWTAGADKQNILYFDEDIYDRDPAVLTELNRPLE
jgi:murein L,D-transpeptidase YcbB/YkuD